MNSSPPSKSATQLNSREAYPWIPDHGDGSYSNPVLFADYSDPDVIRHGRDYYLVASSFNCTPALPILHSTDLVNWTLVNHALKNVPGERYQAVQPGCGVWAPSIRFHTGKFWIFFATPDEGIYQITADDPRGVWSEPHLLQPGKGLIDPCPFWDDDGRAYLCHAYAHSRAGIRDRLELWPMTPDGTRLLESRQTIFHQPQRQPIIEGPKFFKRAGWYYILAPAGGVSTGWQTVLRSRNVFGPYDDRIILEQKRTPTNGPHQGALVDTEHGEFWFLHFQDLGVYGRVTHLQPVRWDGDWPLFGCHQDSNGIGEPVLHHRKPDVSSTSAITVPQTSDEFTGSKLGLQWQWHANHRDDWHSLTARAGWLRLFSRPQVNRRLAETPNLLLQKFPARTFVVETSLSFSPSASGDEAGLVLAGNVTAALVLRANNNTCHLLFQHDQQETLLEALPSNSAKLRVEVAAGGVCTFSLIRDDGSRSLDSKPFTLGPGKWIGAKVGIYCTHQPDATSAGFADFDYFRFSAPA